MAPRDAGRQQSRSLAGGNTATYHVSLDDAKLRLPELVHAAANGETVYILVNEHQVIQLVRAKGKSPNPQLGSAAGLITMSDDFDAPVADLREYMQ